MGGYSNITPDNDALRDCAASVDARAACAQRTQRSRVSVSFLERCRIVRHLARQSLKEEAEGARFW